MQRYLNRFVDPWIAEVLDAAPAVMITGPRASGKTTTAFRYAATVIRLDNPRQAAAFRADPDAALRNHAEPVLLDEWQACPGVLGAVKRAVDTDRRPGRFILTGSARADVDQALWPGTGRLIRIEMHPMAVREQLSKPYRPLLKSILHNELPVLPDDPPDLLGYVEIALRGGFPEPALELEGRVRDGWLSSYVDQLITHELADGRRADPARLAGYFQAYALNSSGVVNDSTLSDTAGIDSRTARSYVRMLSEVNVIVELPAWSTNRLKRLARKPKRYVADTGLWGAAVAADAALVMSDGHLLGRLIDTFVTNQLRAEVAVDTIRSRIHHLRDRDGRHEVDLLVDLGARGVVGLEIKAHSAPTRAHARHLFWLRDRLGDRFKGGAVLHTGPAGFRLGERVMAVPICALWG